MNLRDYQDIYRGLIIDYGPDIPEPHYCWVRETRDSEPLAKLHTYDDACDWIDNHRKTHKQ